METLWYLDHQVFLYINHLPHSALADRIALFLSFVGGNALIWIILIAIVVFREERKDHWFILPCFVAGGASWLFSSVLLKSWFGRARPLVLDGTVLVCPSPSSYSFPSSHAAIAWAFAALLMREEPRFRWLFGALATLISLSRIYLGVHYPSDVVAGSLIGLAVGYAAMALEAYVARQWKHARRHS